MKIALFSDIHANFAALQAVLADIDREAPDALYCLGDLVGYAPFPNEVIAEIRRRRIPTIAGNYDEGIGLASDQCGCAYKTELDRAMGKVSIAYTNVLVGEPERAYLRALPRHIGIDFDFSGRRAHLLLVHGSPRKINEYLFEDREEESLLRIMEQAGAHIMAFGHTHKPYHRVLRDAEGRFRHAINIGSVGKPKDGDPRACYALLHLPASTDLGQPELRVEFRRVPYDVEATARAVEDSPLPNEYADMLRNAY
jgi:predicted phosphodiesterase